MDRRLAAGELQDLGTSFDFDQAIDGADAFLVTQVLAAWTARGIAHGAFKIARRSNLDQTQASVLLVLGTQATVVGAALVGFDAHEGRQLAGKAVLHAIVPADIRANEVLADAVGGASLAEVDPAVARN